MRKKDAIQFFFETLVLKTRDLIEVHQEEEGAKEIQITPLTALFA